ncbi:MAG TPA: M20/M25/M40 family metallo-hydrolase [Pyrinomonadaceae bacterium]|nr:M20/M25/M40 family metallo-hydrolase [Pyrinomonadaceae bacterium]
MKLNTLLIFIFAFNLFAQQSNSIISTQESLTESVKLAPCESKERLETVRKLFAQMDDKEDEITIEKFNKEKIKNVVVKLKGKSDETVIVGAHYDKTDEGCGAIDNWTGVSIIAHLYKTLRQMQTEKSYIFVAFDKEELGLLGSDAMVRAIPKESRSKYCAMVNLDSFGFTAPFSLQQATNSKMVEIAKEIAEEGKIKFVDVLIEGADADSSSFKRNKIPAITFSGLDNKWQTYLHSKNDQFERINMASVYLGYRFALAFIGKLDSIGCSELTK